MFRKYHYFLFKPIFAIFFSGYHYWQPFYGTIPSNAFIAGTDRNGEKKYVARVISPDKRSWVRTLLLLL